MKFLLLWLMMVPVSLLGQNRSNIWQLGTHGLPIYPGYYVDFSQGFADTASLYRPMNFFETDASICDSSGQLLFYTNGVYVANRNQDSLLNTQNFNPGYSTDFYDNEGLGWSQAAIVIPKPGNDDQYIIFSVTGEQFFAWSQEQIQPLHLSYSVIDMNLDGGLGGIIVDKKNLFAVVDTISQGRLTACKHANGRDWWVITHKFHSDRYYKVLVTPDTVLIYQQSIGNVFTSNDIDGMAIFSPDGSHYAQLNINDTLDLLEFNRCSGEFSSPVYLTVPDTPVTLSATLGCSFSPNSRFLYVGTYKRIWQFDTWASDIQSSRLFIDSVNIYTGDDFLFLDQLAPDGKIYISTFGSDGLNPILHVINNPDSLGVACNFLANSFHLPPIAGNFCVPNFPNYDLDSLPGSDTCEIVYTNYHSPPKEKDAFRVAPNPVSEWLNITYQSNQDALFELFDMYGKRVEAISLFHYFKNRLLNVSDLPAGIYLASVTQNGRRVWSEKVVITR